MVARIAAKVVLALAGAALIFFGVGLLGFALAAALVPSLGIAGGAAVAGAVFLVPPLGWALIAAALRPARKPIPGGGPALLTALFAGLAKETPWIAIIGAGLAGVTDLVLKRLRQPPK